MNPINGSFQYRVNFAAAYMVRGIRSSRSLDSCFEMNDGDLVVTALVRRAMQNRRLWDAIASQWRDGFPQAWIDHANEYAHLTTRQLPEASKVMQAEAERKWQIQLAEMQQRKAA